MNDNPHAWPSFVEEASIGPSSIEEASIDPSSIYEDDENELLLSVEMLTKFPNLHVLNFKGYDRHHFHFDYTSFLPTIEKAMTNHSIKVLDFDNRCQCNLSVIKAFLDSQPNLTTLTIPFPSDEQTLGDPSSDEQSSNEQLLDEQTLDDPSSDEYPYIITLRQVLQVIAARSGLIKNIALEADDQFIQTVSQYCHMLEKFDGQSREDITPAGCQTLFAAMITAGRNLQKLNPVQGDYKGQSKHTAKSLPLKHLNLYECDIGDSAFTLAGAMTYLTSLERLYLAACTIDEKHFHKLGPAFEHLPNLDTLHLSYNKIGNSFHAIAQGINACRLTKLKLDGTYLTEESNKALAYMKLPLLTKLSLRDADVTSDGAQALSKSLKHMQSLRVLLLCRNMIGSYGAQAISLSFQYIPQLTQLQLDNNSIGSEGAQALSASFQYLPKLKMLTLHYNPIEPEGVEEIFKHLAHLEYLHRLNLKELTVKPTDTAPNEHSLLQECIEALEKSKESWKHSSHGSEEYWFDSSHGSEEYWSDSSHSSEEYWFDSSHGSEEYWFDIRLDRKEISAVNAVVQQWVH